MARELFGQNLSVHAFSDPLTVALVGELVHGATDRPDIRLVVDDAVQLLGRVEVVL